MQLKGDARERASMPVFYLFLRKNEYEKKKVNIEAEEKLIKVMWLFNIKIMAIIIIINNTEMWFERSGRIP